MCVCNNGNWWYLAYSFSLSPGDNSYLKWRKLEQKLYIVPICMYRSIWGFNITANTLFIWFCFYVGPSVLNLLQIGLDLDTTQIYMYLSSGCSSLTEYAFDFQSSTLAFPYLFVFNFVIFVVVLYWFKTDISGVLKYNRQQTKRKSFLLLWFLKFLNQPKSDDVFPSLSGRHKTKTNQHFVKQKCAITFEADV